MDVDLPHPSRPEASEQRLLLDEREGVGDGFVVGDLDLRGDLRVGDRPQRGDTLDGREGQVETRDRGGRTTGVAGHRPSQLARIDRGAAILGAEELAGNRGADLGADLRGDWPAGGAPGLHRRGRHPAGDLDPKVTDLLVGQPKRRPQPGRRLHLRHLQLGSDSVAVHRPGQGM